jgi:hypothetical protein
MIDWRKRISVDPNTRHYAPKGLAPWFGCLSCLALTTILSTMFSGLIIPPRLTGDEEGRCIV